MLQEPAPIVDPVAGSVIDPVTEALSIIDRNFNYRDLFETHTRHGWVSEFTEDANKDVFGDNPLYFDYHRFSIRFGNRCEACLQEFRSLEGRSLPLYIAGGGVSDEEAAQHWKRFAPKAKRNDIVIFTRIDPVKLAGAVSAFYANFLKQRRKNKSLRLTRKQIEDFDQAFRENYSLDTEVSVLFVDYAEFKNGCLYLGELRTTNNTDRVKSHGTVEHLLKCFVAVGGCDKRVFLGVVSNNQGTHQYDTKNHFAGEWAGTLGSYLHKELILVEKALWDVVGVPGLSWKGFQQHVYKQFLKGMEWEKRSLEEREAILATEKDARRKGATKQVVRASMQETSC